MKVMKGMKMWVTSLLLLASLAMLLCGCARNPDKAKAKYLSNGQNYMKKGQSASAAIEFRNALKIDLRFVDAYYQLAQADLAQHDLRGAYASLARVIELDPNRIDARLDRGRIYLAGREPKKAEDDANFVLAHDAKNAAAYQLLGAALVAQQKNEQALASFSKVADLTPNDSGVYLNMALVEVSLRRIPNAQQDFQRAVQVDPKSVHANLGLANFYYLQGKLTDAEQVLQTAIQSSPEARQLYVGLASMLSGSGKAADADGVLDRLRNQMPKSVDAAIAIADYYALRGHIDKALAEYNRGLSVLPSNLDIQQRMEELYLDSNQIDQAAQMDAQLSKQAPKDVRVRINHGRLLMAQASSQSAVNALQSTVKDAADSPRGHYYLGMAYWQNGNLPQANIELREALRRAPALGIALQSLAKLSLMQGDASGALSYAQELLQRSPADINNRLLLAQVYMAQNQYPRAEQQLLVAKQLAPSNGAVYMGIGQLYAAQKKWPQAEKQFETAAQLEPSSTTILSKYVDFLATRQQLPKAITRVEEFVNNSPENVQGHLILGALQFQAKNYTGAESEFERARRLNPKDVQPYLLLGQLYQAQKQTDAAITQYQEALELRPTVAALCALVGNLYLVKDELNTAGQYFQKALDIDPNFVIANANMAWVDALQGKDLDVALGMAQKAKSQMPELPAIADTLAWVMYKKGNYQGAIPLLQECVQKAPNSAEYHYHLGVVLIAAGQKESGRSQLQAALQMKQLKTIDEAQARQALSQAN